MRIICQRVPTSLFCRSETVGFCTIRGTEEAVSSCFVIIEVLEFRIVLHQRLLVADAPIVFVTTHTPTPLELLSTTANSRRIVEVPFSCLWTIHHTHLTCSSLPCHPCCTSSHSCIIHGTRIKRSCSCSPSRLFLFFLTKFGNNTINGCQINLFRARSKDL